MKQMTTSHIKALIELLEKEKGSQAALLKEELAHIMQDQPHLLRQVIEQDFNASIPASLAQAMQETYWEELAEQLTHFQQKINPELEEALYLSTRFVNPAYSRAEITTQLDQLSHQLQPLLRNCTAVEEIARTMSHFLFSVQRYHVLLSARDIKELSLGHFLQNKRGAALCLCALYTVCAARFGLEAGIIDLAGRLLVRLQTPDSSAPIFIDPFNQGSLVTTADCKQYIFERNLEWNEAFLMTLPSRTLLRHIFSHMIFILNKLRDERRLAFLRRYMDILKDSF